MNGSRHIVMIVALITLSLTTHLALAIGTKSEATGFAAKDVQVPPVIIDVGEVTQIAPENPELVGEIVESQGILTQFLRRTCFVSLRLRTNTVNIDKDVSDFDVFSLTCSNIKKDCLGRVTNHVKDIFGYETNNMKGSTAMKMCELFGMDLPPEADANVDIVYKASNCDHEGYVTLGKLCCYRCSLYPCVWYHPLDDCTPAPRPVSCPT